MGKLPISERADQLVRDVLAKSPQVDGKLTSELADYYGLSPAKVRSILLPLVGTKVRGGATLCANALKWSRREGWTATMLEPGQTWTQYHFFFS